MRMLSVVLVAIIVGVLAAYVTHYLPIDAWLKGFITAWCYSVSYYVFEKISE